ncbi:MAG TPA: hypothetical protein VFL17_08095, partial [Anaerolineae bacterium]|nr:hypothetical protein [Anaerolineae bacterium]
MSKPWIILSLVALGFILAACSGSTSSAPGPDRLTPKPADTAGSASESAAQPAANAMQFNDEAAVRVEVTPLNLDDPSAATIDFRIA